MHDSIYAYAAAMLSLDEATEPLKNLCDLAYEEYVARLLPDTSPESISGVLTAAAALSAVSVYLQLTPTAASFSSVKVGGISVSNSGSESSSGTVAAALKAQAENLILHYTRDDSFHFKAVRG